MRRPRCALAVCLGLAFGSFVQFGGAQEYPVAEVSLGFAVLNNEYGKDRQNSSGVQLAFAYNLARQLRLVGDFGFETHSTDLFWYSGRRADANSYQVLFGPEFTFRQKPRFTPFVHGLAGTAGRHFAVPNGQWTCTGYGCYEGHFDLAQEAGFASGVGGGLDWHIWPRASLRLVQFDWIHTNLSRDNAISPAQGQLPTLKGWQDNYRFSCGFVLRLGSKGYQERSRQHQ